MLFKPESKDSGSQAQQPGISMLFLQYILGIQPDMTD